MSNAMRVCPYCQAAVDDEALFCGNCGRGLTPPPLVNAPTAVAPVVAGNQRSNTPLIVALSVVSVLLVAVIVLLVTRGGTDTSNASTVTDANAVTPTTSTTAAPASTAAPTTSAAPTTVVVSTVPRPAPSTAAPAPPSTAKPKVCPNGLRPVYELPLFLCDEGYPVTYVQMRLNGDGAGLEEDGQFGPATESAVRAFQRYEGLPVTGVVDLDTWAAMFMYWGLPGYDIDGNGVITPSEIIGD